MRFHLVPAIVLLWFLFYSPARGQGSFQPGYLVLLRGDTLRGLVATPTRNTVMRGVEFKKSVGEANKIFYPNKLVRAVQLTGGKTYLMRKMQPMMLHDTLRILLEPLVQGRATLFRSSRNVFSNDSDAEMFGNSFSSVYYYVERVNTTTRPPFLLNPTHFRENLDALFADCPTAPTITGKFEEPNLVHLVRQYNSCPAR